MNSQSETSIIRLLKDFQRKIIEMKYPLTFDPLPIIHLEPQSDILSLNRFQASHGFKLPTDLVQLFSQYSEVTLPDNHDSWNSLRLFSNIKTPFPGLLEFINWSWGGRPEIEKTIPPSEISDLNSKYRCFGYFKIDDNAYEYFVFDRNEQIYSIFYDQDDWRNFLTLLKSELKPQTTQQLFTHYMNKVIDQLKEDYSEGDSDSSEETYVPDFFKKKELEMKNVHPSSQEVSSLLVQKMTELALNNDSLGMFLLLKDWPDRSSEWVLAVRSRLFAPSCTPQEKLILKKLLDDQ